MSKDCNSEVLESMFSSVWAEVHRHGEPLNIPFWELISSKHLSCCCLTISNTEKNSTWDPALHLWIKESRDFNRLPVTMEHSLVPSEETKWWFLPCVKSSGCQCTCYSFTPNSTDPVHLPETASSWYYQFTRLYLKDTSSFLQVAPASQPLFTLKKENLYTGWKGQLMWTPLP